MADKEIITKPKLYPGSAYQEYGQDTYVSRTRGTPKLVPEGGGPFSPGEPVFDKDLNEDRLLSITEGKVTNAPPTYPFPREKSNFRLTEEGDPSTQTGPGKSFEEYMKPAQAADKAKGEKPKAGPPSFETYLSYATDNALNSSQAASAMYPEETDPMLTKAMQQSNPVAEKLRSLGKMPPEERAKTGAALGAVAGMQFMGQEEGAIIGGSIGAMIGRGAGMAQSGEQAKLDRDNRIWNSMKTMGVVGPDGKVKFKGSTVQMPAEATGRLKNLTKNIYNGAADRSLYEIDGTNPFTQRGTSVARPLGMYLAQGMLGYRNRESEVDKGASKAATAMLANTLIEGADNEEQVYARGRQMVKKMGISRKALDSYFASIAKDMSIEEAEEIKRGIDILFAK